jgi:hypothetical protein
VAQVSVHLSIFPRSEYLGPIEAGAKRARRVAERGLSEV